MVISAIVIAMVVVNIFVIPSFARIFANFHAELPLITRGLIGMSNGIRSWWPHILGGVALVILGVRHWVGTPRGAETWGRKSLRIPPSGRSC